MGAGPSTTKPKEDTTSATGRPLVSPRGSKPVQVEDEQGLSAEEARLLRSMQATTSSAPAKKWGDVSPRGVAPTGPISPRGPSSEAMVSPRSAPPSATPAQEAPAVVNRSEDKTKEEAPLEVVAGPEEVKRKEEEQATKEAARLDRLLAKKFMK